ncbi:prolactin-like [Heterocephalus glaber]|uniref:Prolactin-like n=1 Tax=Heterocephalus glaber TaxID=10181 RepID=A0AAX6T408_HETGA|nr:prolactin-like [Heterocephalus glaber]
MADILTPYWQNKARLMQEKDLVHMAVYLLNSWNDTLPGLALDTHILLKFYHPHSSKDRNITLTYQQLKEVTVQIASQLDIEVPDKVNFALQSYTESLMSSDERTLLFSVYSTLRCFFIDVKKIHFLFSLLKCRADNKVNC